MNLGILAVWSLASVLCAEPLADSVSLKLGRIENGQFAPGSRVFFTPSEMNSWIRRESADYPGVREPRVAVQDSKATGYALVDFSMLDQAPGNAAPSWFLRKLLGGEHPVTVNMSFESQKGKARVNVERVEIAGIPIEGAALDFLIEQYVRPLFPGARISEWFDLDPHVDRFTVGAAGLAVYIGGKR